MNEIKTMCRDIDKLKPLAQVACRLFLNECKKEGISIFITETYRSQDRQNYLYEQGRTAPGRVVTWTRTSNHTGRMAWDIACSPPLPLYNAKTLNAAGNVAKRLGITWGGTWQTPDAPHFEIKNDWKEPIANKGDGKMSYEQFKEYIKRYEKEKETAAASEWARLDFEKATQAGIVDGTMPQASATREQIVSILSRLGLIK